MPCIITEYCYQQIFVNAKAGTPSPGLAGVFNGCKMGLYQNNIGLTDQTILADLTPADYNTYALQLAGFGAPYRRASGGVAISSAFLEWQMTDALAPNLLYGYYIVNAAGTNLLVAETFGTGGISLADTLSAINVSSEVVLGGIDNGVMSLSY